MQLFDDLHSGCEADFDQPLIAYLRTRQQGKLTPPYIPQWKIQSLQKQCRQALLWAAAGFEKEAGELTHWLNQFSPELLPLWCPEKEYNEKEGRRLFSLLSQIEPIPGKNPDWGLEVFQSPFLTTAFTLSGNGTSLGVIRTPEVEIRAFGPQALPFNRFGIQGVGIDHWIRCEALAEVWLQMKTEVSEHECKIDLRFVGLKPENPLAFVFYVKAKSCQVHSETIRPRSLRRFHGEAAKVQFNKLQIESSLPHKVEVIPLAGEGCFWDTDFLVAFEIHPFSPQMSFLLN